MPLNEQVSAERLHIGFFGLRNAGKSSLVNAVTGQNLAVVSAHKGTTTDPVKKSMELLPLGPVVIIDTPGIDDEGDLGKLRVQKTHQVLNSTDIAVLVVDAMHGFQPTDHALLSLFQKKEIPYLVVYNKADLLDTIPAGSKQELYVSAVQNWNIQELKERIAHLRQNEANQKKLVADLISPNDFVLLVTPIDSAAPKGRLILPQQQTIRELLDSGAIPIVVRETELPLALSNLKHLPRLVITDSQVFEQVNQSLPSHLPLTSFSILFARYKGDLPTLVSGAAVLDQLQDQDRILISEGCTHHRQCGDIGTEKLPRWIQNYTGKHLQFTFTSGTEFPEDLSPYAMVIHCGGCMLNAREMKSRIRCCSDFQVPVTNYGTAIAHMHGILKRSLEPFSDLYVLFR